MSSLSVAVSASFSKPESGSLMNSSRRTRRRLFSVREYREKSAPFTTSGRLRSAKTGRSRLVKYLASRAASAALNSEAVAPMVRPIVAPDRVPPHSWGGHHRPRSGRRWEGISGSLGISVKEASESVADIDWTNHWRRLVKERSAVAGGHGDSSYWDRRAPPFARSTRTRVDDFIAVVAPYLSPRKTLIDVGAGAGRHALPLAERLEWVTAVEPSEGMRALIPLRDNMTVVASTWEDAAVAPADLVICCHVMYGVEEPVSFIVKMERSSRERIFIMMREVPMVHPAAVIRERLLGAEDPRMPRFTDLFMLLMQMGIAPDVDFIRYPIVQRYVDIDEALADCRPLVGEGWDEAKARAILLEVLAEDEGELVFEGGVTLSGIANWQPQS